MREDGKQWEGELPIEERTKLTPEEFQKLQDELANKIRSYLEENYNDDQNDVYKINL